MSVGVENIDGSADLNLSRDRSRDGYVHIEAVVFEDSRDTASTFPLGTYRIRDLLIALHALSAAPAAIKSPPEPDKTRWFFGKREDDDDAPPWAPPPTPPTPPAVERTKKRWPFGKLDW